MVRTSDKTMTFPDKTNNMYRLSNNQYNMLLKIFIASTYKKPNNNIKKKINIIERNILLRNCFITLIEHQKTSRKIHQCC